jgi:hypothetical protein
VSVDSAYEGICDKSVAGPIDWLTQTPRRVEMSPVFPIDIDIALRIDRSNWLKNHDRDNLFCYGISEIHRTIVKQRVL